MDVEQRRNVCRLIAGLVVSDDDLSPAEDAFVNRMLAGFGIPASERETIFPIVDASEAAAEMQKLPAAVQQEALAMLLQAAAVDGKIVPEERDYLHTVGRAIGLSTDEVDRRLAAAVPAR